MFQVVDELNHLNCLGKPCCCVSILSEILIFRYFGIGLVTSQNGEVLKRGALSLYYAEYRY